MKQRHNKLVTQIHKKKRKELGIEDNSFVVGHVGRFADVKNHLFLLDVFIEISLSRPSAELLLVGDGELRSKIEEKAAELRLKNKVIFTGDRSDVNELMMVMDVFVFPSKYEGLPVTLVEAQCSGLPCLVSDMIPSDSILIKELVQVCSLQDPASDWADAALQCRNENRIACAEKIKEAGFDIEKNAKWLEEFYFEKTK